MNDTTRAVRFLDEIDRGDLAGLIRYSTYDWVTENDAWGDISVYRDRALLPQALF